MKRNEVKMQYLVDVSEEDLMMIKKAIDALAEMTTIENSVLQELETKTPRIFVMAIQEFIMLNQQKSKAIIEYQRWISGLLAEYRISKSGVKNGQA